MEIEQLVKELTEAARVYYQEEGQLMTDDEYDTKVEYLEDLVDKGELELTDELNELLYSSISAGSVPVGTTIEHDYPMLSLAKAKNSDELKRYHDRLIKNGATGFNLQMKFDGLALSAKYSSGKLTQLATRGDGQVGELLNHLITNKDVTIVGLPLQVKEDYDFELRGELYITDSQFKTINKRRKEATGEEFSNSRNAATGIVKRSEREMDYKAELTFTAYSVYHNGEQVPFNQITSSKLKVVPTVTSDEVKRIEGSDSICSVDSVNFSELEKAVADFGDVRANFEIPTDGVVIKPKNEIEMLNKMGYTSRHPIAYIAYKYPGTKEITTVKEIIVSVGKTGRLTPQAIVEPVDVDGVTIQNLTCHNYSWMINMGIRPGATVAITRANDVIPAIDVVINKGPEAAVKVPKNCPECGEKLKGDGELPKTLTCENLECPSRLLYHMKSIVGRNYLYLEGLGNVALEALVEQGILTSVVDLFKLDEETLSEVVTGTTSSGNIRKLGRGNAKNIMESIERAKAGTDSHKLLASLNIEGMGPNTAKRLITHFGGIEEVLNINPNELREVDQVGDSLVDSFSRHQKVAKEQYEAIIELGLNINEVKEVQATQGSFSVSGSVEGFANRNEFVEHMENLGWEFHKSPKKSTDVLFADPESTTAKVNKARSNGTKIMKDLTDLNK